MKDKVEIGFVTSFPSYEVYLKQTLEEQGMEGNVICVPQGKTFDWSKRKEKLLILTDNQVVLPKERRWETVWLPYATLDCLFSLGEPSLLVEEQVFVAAEEMGQVDLTLLTSLTGKPFFLYDTWESRDHERFFHAPPNALYLTAPHVMDTAKKAGLCCRMLRHHKDSLEASVREGKKALEVKAREDEKNKENLLRMEQYKVVFNFTNDAILATDENGIIIAANDMVYQFLRHDPKDRLEGKRIDKVVKGTKMIKAMEKEGGDVGDVFELPYCTVLTHRIPIQIDGKCKGVVSTFQDLAVLQEHEKNARMYYKNKKGFTAKYRFDDIKGSSKKIQEVKNIAKSYASSAASVLIMGETGTGKELFAQSIHNQSPRCGGPFVALNCAAIPKNLLEAELFGYEEGSFTGASKGGKMGMFEMAHKGTIFLDEIGEMPLEMQAQLLRVIQEKEVRRIGSDKVVPVEVRVISATNRNLQGEVEAGRFREDLFYRLNVLELKIPPLRERKEDIAEIAIDYLKHYNFQSYCANEALWEQMIESLEKQELRGNVRELQNMLERLSVMLENKHINTNALFSEISRGLNRRPQAETAGQLRYEDEPFEAADADRWEKQRILQALKKNNFSRTKTAEELGISRSTLWNKMKYHKINL